MLGLIAMKAVIPAKAAFKLKLNGNSFGRKYFTQ